MRKLFMVPVLFVMLAGVLFSQSNMDVVATVNLTKPEPITVKQLKDKVAEVEKAYNRTLNAEERRDVLDMMINERLAVQAAARDKISISDEDINRQISMIRAQLAQSLGHEPTDTELSALIQQQTGKNLASFREDSKKDKDLLVQKYLLEKKAPIFEALKNYKPTDKDIKNEYELNAKEFIQDPTVQFTAIFFPFKNSSDKAKAKADAEKLSKEINGNINLFDEKVQKGNTAEYRPIVNRVVEQNAAALSRVGQSFLDAAFSLQQGKVSDVVEIPRGESQGYYIIKVTGNYPRKTFAIDDVMPLPQYNNPTVRQYLEVRLMQRKQQEALLTAQEELVTELRKGSPFSVNEKNLNY
jgi:hypothetical protein